MDRVSSSSPLAPKPVSPVTPKDPAAKRKRRDEERRRRERAAKGEAPIGDAQGDRETDDDQPGEAKGVRVDVRA